MSSPDHSSETCSDSDSNSDGSYHAARPSRLCPHRTTRFYHGECSRFFDCPSHQVERARSESSTLEDEDEEEEEEEEEDDDDDDDEEDRLEDDYLTDLNEDGRRPAGRDLEHRRRRRSSAGQDQSRHHIIDLTTPSPECNRPPSLMPSSDAPGPAISTRTHGDVTHNAHQPNSQRGGPVVIDLTGRDLPAERPPTAPTSDSSSHGSGGTVSPSSQQRHPVTPPAPPPAARRRISTNNFDSTRADYQHQVPDPESTRPSDIALPRWQPDAEVTLCPICHTQFSIFIRKHHCRKCGRVVCNSCSPHRITIPYQYIVHPPGTPRPGSQRHSSSFLSVTGGFADFSSLGGGEAVRLCNPCVPDPNPNPPQAHESSSSIQGHARSESGSGGAMGYASTFVSAQSRPASYLTTRVAAGEGYGRNRSVTMLPGGARQTSGSRYYQYQSTQNRILSATPPANYQHAIPSSSSRNSSSSQRVARYRSSAASGSGTWRPLPPDPPQLAEEDECPVCHRELPPCHLANYEALREAHINMCITSHSAYGTPSGEGSRTVHRTGMFPYFATEKDCVDSAECTICLEEFEVGIPMARLECFCRFHRDCISRWFAKNPGRCPVHQHALS